MKSSSKPTAGLVEKRIADLRGELDRVQRRKEREVAARSDRMTVSLVGYTNAGKSTLLNKLTGSDELAEDKLFATLDTRTRRWQLPGWGPVLLSDTVGFIRDLPHSLIASFKATLEEARQADLLLHVADASNPAALDQITAVYEVLEELGINEKDTILVLNQVDRDRRTGTSISSKEHYPSAIPVSARTGEGLNQLVGSGERCADAPLSWMSTSKPTWPTAGCWRRSPRTAKSSAAPTPRTAFRSIAACRASF